MKEGVGISIEGDERQVAAIRGDRRERRGGPTKIDGTESRGNVPLWRLCVKRTCVVWRS